jgi:hypothetical protein
MNFRHVKFRRDSTAKPVTRRVSRVDGSKVEHDLIGHQSCSLDSPKFKNRASSLPQLSTIMPARKSNVSTVSNDDTNTKAAARDDGLNIEVCA